MELDQNQYLRCFRVDGRSIFKGTVLLVLRQERCFEENRLFSPLICLMLDRRLDVQGPCLRG